jgi:hypothetical protein
VEHYEFIYESLGIRSYAVKRFAVPHMSRSEPKFQMYASSLCLCSIHIWKRVILQRKLWRYFLLPNSFYLSRFAFEFMQYWREIQVHVSVYGSDQDVTARYFEKHSNSRLLAIQVTMCQLPLSIHTDECSAPSRP